MDGHEQEDVVKYQETIFLPKMEEFEHWMPKFEGAELKCTEPNLQPGEQVLIPQWHDETCFHAND